MSILILNLIKFHLFLLNYRKLYDLYYIHH
jgi:hypothetical protein